MKNAAPRAVVLVLLALLLQVTAAGASSKRIVIGPDPDGGVVRPGRTKATHGPRTNVYGVGGDDESRVEVDLRFDYQRVDGLNLGVALGLRGYGDRAPKIDLSLARALHRGRWLYDVAFEQPLLVPGLSIGASLFRATELFDDLDAERVSDVENVIATSMVKEDFRDYHEAEGAAAFVKQQIGPTALAAHVVRADHRAVTNSTRTSLTRWDSDFRPNPAAGEGSYRALRLQVALDTRRSHPMLQTAQWLRAGWEEAGRNLGGDFNFSRATLDLRNFVRTSPGQQLRVRLAWGSVVAGTAPIQKQFALGGVGTLRGQSFKSLSGDEFGLANIEYLFQVTDEAFALVFLDSGATAVAGQDLSDQRFALDGGFGVGFYDRMALYVGRDVRASSAPVRVNFRLTSTF